MSGIKKEKVVIVCVRGSKKMSAKELRENQPKTPTLAISCANGDHEDCPGYGCECDCKHLGTTEL